MKKKIIVGLETKPKGRINVYGSNKILPPPFSNQKKTEGGNGSLFSIRSPQKKTVHKDLYNFTSSASAKVSSLSLFLSLPKNFWLFLLKYLAVCYLNNLLCLLAVCEKFSDVIFFLGFCLISAKIHNSNDLDLPRYGESFKIKEKGFSF